jgi:hypothetical protein
MKKLSLLLILAVTALSACRKEVTQVQPKQAVSVQWDIQANDWYSEDGGVSYAASADLPELTDAIFDHGAVLVYLSFDDNIYEALPEVFDGISYGAIHSPGALTVDMHAVDGGTIPAPSGLVYAKIILIDAPIIAMHPELDLTDYNQVKKVLRVN